MPLGSLRRFKQVHSETALSRRTAYRRRRQRYRESLRTFILRTRMQPSRERRRRQREHRTQMRPRLQAPLPSVHGTSRRAHRQRKRHHCVRLRWAPVCEVRACRCASAGARVGVRSATKPAGNGGRRHMPSGVTVVHDQHANFGDHELLVPDRHSRPSVAVSEEELNSAALRMPLWPYSGCADHSRIGAEERWRRARPNRSGPRCR